MRHATIALLALSSLLPALPASAKEEAINPQMEYHTCLTLARAKPEDGWEEAIAWSSLGGGEPARHCAAVALIGLGKYEEAAKRLESLAEISHREAPLRAEMLAQAGQAWLMAKNPDRALAAQDAALKLLPGAPEIELDKAVTLASVGHYAEVADLLTGLLRVQPNRIEAMVLRATAYRYLDKLELAKDDLARALVLDPNFPDAYLERGMVRRLEGRDAEAREDWMKAIALLPNSTTADTARENLAKMDVKTQ